MYGQTETQEKQKKKIIIVSLIMGIIILVLIGVLISAISNKNKAKLAEKAAESSLVREDEKSDVTKVEDEPKAEDTKLDPVSNEAKDTEETETETVATVTPSSTSVGNDLPQTGPGSVLGLALLMGSATTYAFSKKRF